MTKVKLKLMFFLLNAFLTADFVYTRPYLDITNGTFSKNDNKTNIQTFNIPVEAESDTLTVAEDGYNEHTEEETNKSSKREMDDIMTAEQNRDERMSKKTMDASIAVLEEGTSKGSKREMDDIMNAEQNRDEKISKKTMDASAAVLKLPGEDADQFQKDLNISSPVMEGIFEAETGREQSLTDILFSPESDIIVDAPRFEYLVTAKVNKSTEIDQVNKIAVNLNDYEKGLNNSSIDGKIDYVELVEIVKPTKFSENRSAYSLGNITGHYVENDAAPDTSFTDMQTLFVSCIGTLLPLLVVLCLTFVIRYICRRWCNRCKQESDSSCSESSEQKDDQQLKSADLSLTDPGDGSSNGPAPSNGSIITMTLKNNHLIVETEERNDITKNGRETKMKYSPDNDGIFVVEVQQSAIYRPINMQHSPPFDPQISTNQALIHRIPEDNEIPIKTKKNLYLNEFTSSKFDKEKTLALSNTGLSISDLSMSSVGSHNVSYSYGSQMGYEQGPFGYPIYAGYEVTNNPLIGDSITQDNSREPLICKTPTDPDKPIVTAAIFKQDSLIGNDALQGPVYCIEGSSDGPLLSDVQAREVSLQKLHDKMEKKIENGVAVPIPEKIDSPKKSVLNRADSLPVRIEENSIPPQVVDRSAVMETITEDNNISPINKDILRGKRASLPNIKTDMYDSVKGSILPMVNFEKVNNEYSNGEGGVNYVPYPPPMITISEENEITSKEESSTS